MADPEQGQEAQQGGNSSADFYKDLDQKQKELYKEEGHSTFEVDHDIGPGVERDKRELAEANTTLNFTNRLWETNFGYQGLKIEEPIPASYNLSSESRKKANALKIVQAMTLSQIHSLTGTLANYEPLLQDFKTSRDANRWQGQELYKANEEAIKGRAVQEAQVEGVDIQYPPYTNPGYANIEHPLPQPPEPGEVNRNIEYRRREPNQAEPSPESTPDQVN